MCVAINPCSLRRIALIARTAVLANVRVRACVWVCVSEWVNKRELKKAEQCQVNENVCVWGRERDRERGRVELCEIEKNERLSLCVNDAEESVWLFKSVCVRERERDWEREREKHF